MSQVFKRVWKIGGKFSPGPPPVLNVNGDKLYNNQAVANTLAETFSFMSTRASRSPAVRRWFEADETFHPVGVKATMSLILYRNCVQLYLYVRTLPQGQITLPTL